MCVASLLLDFCIMEIFRLQLLGHNHHLGLVDIIYSFASNRHHKAKSSQIYVTNPDFFLDLVYSLSYLQTSLTKHNVSQTKPSTSDVCSFRVFFALTMQCILSCCTSQKSGRWSQCCSSSNLTHRSRPWSHPILSTCTHTSKPPSSLCLHNCIRHFLLHHMLP